jgi:hypothetical protein
LAIICSPPASRHSSMSAVSSPVIACGFQQ